MAFPRSGELVEDMESECQCDVSPSSSTSYFYHLKDQSFLEEPGEGHWYPSVLNNDKVNDFVRELLDSYPPRQPIVAKLFTLTVSIPWESGSLHGWRVQALTTPGR